MTSTEEVPNGQERRATLMLFVVTVLWGMSFPWTKNWQDGARSCPGGELLASLTLIGLRMPLAVLLLGLWQPRLVTTGTRQEHAAGALLGGVFFAGFLLQTWGLAYTTPALSAFFTSLCSAWVPLVAWYWWGSRAAPLTLLGLAFGLAGCSVLVEGGWKVGRGDLATLLCSFVFAGQVLLLEALGQRFRSAHLSVGFLGATGLLGLLGAFLVALTGPGLAAWAGWVADMLGDPVVLRNLLCLVILPTVLGFHWMNTFQPQLPASRAALIYLLEPVFSSFFSVWSGHDQVAVPLLLGGGLILMGNLLVEMPRWVRAGRSA